MRVGRPSGGGRVRVPHDFRIGLPVRPQLCLRCGISSIDSIEWIPPFSWPTGPLWAAVLGGGSRGGTTIVLVYDDGGEPLD